MGFILNTVIKNAADDHPFPDLSHCINRKQKRLACSACVEACPKQVYDAELAKPPKWDECQNCGLCVTACKSRCIAPSPGNVKRHLLLAQKQGEIVLSCRRAQVQTEHVQECLALVPWEFLAYLALGGKLTLNLKACTNCPHEENFALLEEQLYQLKCFLGEENYARHVCLCLDREEAQEAGVSRRDFFRMMALGGKKTAAMAASDMAGEKADAMFYRRMLARRVSAYAKEHDAFQCRMLLPWFSDQCYGCGVCAQLCPNKAIEIGEEQEGRRVIYLYPYRCTGCGVCQAVCRQNGIEEICMTKVPHLNRLLLRQVNSRSCEDCGRAIMPSGDQKLCMGCLQKRRK